MDEAIKFINDVIDEIIFQSWLHSLVMKELWQYVEIMLLELQIQRLMRCREYFLAQGFNPLQAGKMAVATLTDLPPDQCNETINLRDFILEEDGEAVGERVELRVIKNVTFLNFKEGANGVPVQVVQEISTTLSARMTAYDLAG